MADFGGRGFKIHYVEQGAGPSVVFAHGIVMDHTMYLPQFEDLPDAYRCIAWDMRGHGNSECPPGPWSIQDIVVDLVGFIEATNAAPCHLVGMSTGGMAALRLAIQREDLLRSLVLIDTNAEAESPESAELYRGFQAAIAADDGVSEELARNTVPLLYGQAYIEREPDAIEIHVDRVCDMPGTAVIEGLRALIGRPSLTDRLADIRVPTLVIHGEEDAAIPVDGAVRMAGAIPGAELERIAGAGHTTPLEAPDAVNRALTQFFARVG
jgi:pimeloyl-ACP methyl ester carboxylesterase